MTRAFLLATCLVLLGGCGSDRVNVGKSAEERVGNVPSDPPFSELTVRIDGIENGYRFRDLCEQLFSNIGKAYGSLLRAERSYGKTLDEMPKANKSDLEFGERWIEVERGNLKRELENWHYLGCARLVTSE